MDVLHQQITHTLVVRLLTRPTSYSGKLMDIMPISLLSSFLFSEVVLREVLSKLLY